MAVVVGVVVVIVLFGLIALGASVRVLREYERGVVFRLGRLIATKGPGLILLIPFIDRMVKVDLRTVTLNIPPQEVITRDNVPCRVNAVAYFRVVDQNRAVVEVENYLVATSQISQTALRSVLGKAELDQLLADRERLNEDLQKIIDESTEPWGVKVTAVEIKDVEIPDQMQRAMARQAEAERERRAKIINSEGEFQAAQKLTDAADIISTNPASLQLRYLQTLLEIGSNQNTTVVFPLPMDVLEPFVGGFQRDKGKPPKPRPNAPAPPHGGEPVPGVEGSGLPSEAEAGAAPATAAASGDAPAGASGDDGPGAAGGTRPGPGVTPPDDDAPAPGDLPPSRS
jgi:regulator of protease activity HflC (stomatin/prohibitin superfamily)